MFCCVLAVPSLSVVIQHATFGTHVLVCVWTFPGPEELRRRIEVNDRILTVPNLLSFVRLLLVPVFLWLVLGPERDGLALLVLMISGVTDYLDGKLARKFNQSSKIGAILDPVADRVYILAVVIGLGFRD